MTNIIRAVFNCNEYDTTAARPDNKPIYQYNYGQILQIHGLDLPKAVEIHFSHSMVGSDAIIRIGTTTDKVTEVAVPEKFLEAYGTVTAYIYVSDTESGQTEYKIQFQIAQRAKPEAWDSPEDGELFHQAIEAVNTSAGKAEDAAVRAEVSAGNAGQTAQDAEISATAAKTSETTAKNLADGFLKTVDDAKADITTHATQEKEQAISAIKAQGEEVQENISESVNTANTAKSDLETAINNASTTKSQLEQDITNAGESQVQAVNDAGATQVQAVQQEGADQIQIMQSQLVDYAKVKEVSELRGDLDNTYNELSVVDEGIYSSVTISTNATAKNATADGTTVTIPKDVNCGGAYIGYRYGITDNDKGKRLKIVMPYSTTIPNTGHYIFNVLHNNSGIEFETIVSEDICTFIVNISKDCTATYFMPVFHYTYYGTYSVSNTITVDYPTFIGLYGNTQRVQKMIDNSIYTNKSNYVGKRLACFGDSYTAQGKWQPHVVEILGLDGFDGFSQSGGTLTSIYEEISNINANADILNVWIGTNDYSNNRKIGNLLDDVTDESTHDPWGYASFCGALNYICNWIATNMPTKTIIFNTPTYRHNESDDTRDTENGRNDKGYIKNGAGNSLEDYANAMIMVANHWGYPVNDLFHNSGINEITYPSFYQTDRLHPSDNGARILARKIAEFINMH